MTKRAVRGGGLLLAVAGLVGAGPALAQEGATGPTLRVNAAEIAIGGRVQTQFNTTTAEAEPGTELFLRRVRLEAAVKVNEVVSGKVQPDFAGNRVVLKDAWVRFDFSPALAVVAGSQYRPFSLLEQTSSTRILPVERGAAIRGVEALDEYELIHGLAYSDRDVGVTVRGAPRGAPLAFDYAVGAFRGPLHGAVGDRDSYQFVARAGIRPARKLAVGVGWSTRDFSRQTGSGSGAGFDLERGSAFEVDAEYGAFAPGLHLMGEVARGDLDPFTGQRFTGAQLWVGFRTGPAAGGRISAVEPLFRASYGDADRGADGALPETGTLLTPGLNLWLGGLNRIQLNYDVWRGRDRSEGSFKAQFQMAF